MQISSPKVNQIHFFPEPDPTGGAYSAPPDLLAGGEGVHCTLPKNLSLPRSQPRTQHSDILLHGAGSVSTRRISTR